MPYRHWISFLFFFLISIVFWFFNALGKEYTEALTYPVRFVNFPQDVLLVNDLPQRLTIDLSCPGYQMLRHKIGGKLSPLTINLNHKLPKLLNPKDSVSYYMQTDFFRDLIASQLGEETVVVDINPDSVFFQFDKMEKKKCGVRLNSKIHFSKQFRQNGKIEILPDSVVVRGPKAIIDTLTWVKTDIVDLKDVESSLLFTVELENNPKLAYSIEEVSVSIPVEQFTEKSLYIPIDIINQPDSVELVIFPSKSKVTFLVSFSDYELINDRQFEVYVDYMDVYASKNNKLNVFMRKSPEYIYSVKVHPPVVEYIIRESK